MRKNDAQSLQSRASLINVSALAFFNEKKNVQFTEESGNIKGIGVMSCN